MTAVPGLSGLSSLIQPDHPAIAGYAAELQGDPDLPASLTRVFGKFTWVGTRGMASYDEVIRDGQGNCLALSAMLSAAAAAAGWDQSCILVSGGGLLSQSLIVTTNNSAAITVHAWAILVPPTGDGCIIDPVNMKPRPLGTADEFQHRLKVAAPVDKILPLVISLAGTRVFATSRQAHAYLVSLWKR